MIYSLNGLVSHIEPNIAIIECNNIGFKCNISNNTASNLKIGVKAFLYTYMNIKEDSVDLFGFSDKDELKCFKTLINISGIGPKAAISILSSFSPQALSTAVSTNDYKIITKCPGIGQKTAQRIVLELKDKLDIQISSSNTDIYDSKFNNSNFNEAIEALKTLGYTEPDILKTINQYDKSLSTEDIIKKALKEL